MSIAGLETHFCTPQEVTVEFREEPEHSAIVEPPAAEIYTSGGYHWRNNSEYAFREQVSKAGKQEASGPYAKPGPFLREKRRDWALTEAHGKR